MKKYLLLCGLSLFIFFSCKKENENVQTGQEDVSLETLNDKAYYSLIVSTIDELNYGNDYKHIDKDSLVMKKALNDILKGDIAFGRDSLNYYIGENFAKKELKTKELVDSLRKEINNDLQMQKTKSGVSYKMLKEGEGKIPTLSDLVFMNITGKDLLGKPLFQSDSTVAYIVKALKQNDLKEVLQHVKEGSHFIVYIDNGETICDVKLVSVKPIDNN